MKKFKKFGLSLFILLIITLLIGSAYADLALDDTENSQAVFKVDVTGLIEPVVGQVPSFDYDVKAINPYGDNFSSFDFIAWLETDSSYDETVSFIEKMNSDTASEEDYQAILRNARASLNPESDWYDVYSEYYDLPEIDKYITNKTYVAIFGGQPLPPLVSTPDLTYSSPTVIFSASPKSMSTKGLRQHTRTYYK